MLEVEHHQQPQKRRVQGALVVVEMVLTGQRLRIHTQKREKKLMMLLKQMMVRQVIEEEEVRQEEVLQR